MDSRDAPLGDRIRELYNVYLVDDARHLKGSLSLRDMVLARPGMPMKTFMDPNPVRATTDMDQEEEATEDLSRFAGVSELSLRPGRIFRVSRARLPWLLLGLLGGFASGRILQGFEWALAEVLELAFFVPVIMALAGNIGIQSSTIVVRGLATGEIREGETRRLIAREAEVSIINGFVIMIVTLAIYLLIACRLRDFL